MPTRPEVAAAIQSALGSIDAVVIKPMFGEFGIWIDGKIVGLIADDLLFAKPSKGAAPHTAGFDEAPPYPGAKPSIMIPEDRWSDTDWMTTLFRDSADSLPAPKPKKKP